MNVADKIHQVILLSQDEEVVGEYYDLLRPCIAREFEIKNEEDIAGDRDFMLDTQAEPIDVKKRPLPLNIFAQVAGNEAEQKAFAERIVGVFKNVEANFGKVPEESLYQAILRGFEENDPYPDFDVIRSEVQKLAKKADTLTSILRPLVEQRYFAQTGELIYETWTNNSLVIDLHEIEPPHLTPADVFQKPSKPFAD